MLAHGIELITLQLTFSSLIINNLNVVTRTQAVKDTKAQHTSDYLHKLVMDVLEDFNINKSYESRLTMPAT